MRTTLEITARSCNRTDTDYSKSRRCANDGGSLVGVYIHIPFCVRKCLYCDFVSYCGKDELFDAYLSALEDEIREYEGTQVDTIFIGGGTPTVLSAKQLERLCRAVTENFKTHTNLEFTCEANPGTLNADKIAALLNGGVNRMSVGVQSFNDNELKTIGRIHSAGQAYKTIEELHKSGFDNISADIMTALPNQNMRSLMNTLETAAALPLKHISAYSLIIEEGTPMEAMYKKGELNIPDEDEDRNMYAETKRFLEEKGFMQYEISNFAQKGYESRHNIKYWQCREYIGLGAAAHSYVNGVRYSNTNSVESYIKGNRRGEEYEVLGEDDKIFEFIIMGMRMNEGISETEFKRRFNRDFRAEYGELLGKFESGGFIKSENGYIAFTDKGRDISNSILCEFAPI